MDPQGNKPPVLDGTNYAVWKVRTRAYIKAIDEKAWRSILTGWEPPKTEPDGDGDVKIIPEEEWDNSAVTLANYNSKDLNVIFGYIDSIMFKLVCNYVSAKDAWEMLQNQCEGSAKVKQAKLSIHVTQFENMRMDESEFISDYGTRLCEIPNDLASLGDPISNKNLVSKLLRIAHKHFHVKITAIREYKDPTTLRFDELIGNLLAYDMEQKTDQSSAKSSSSPPKTIALKTGEIVDNSEAEPDTDIEDNSDLSEKVNFLTKRVKQLAGKDKSALKPKRLFNNPSPSSSNNFRPGFTPNQPTNINIVKCRVCKGMGHYASECANVLRRMKLSFAALLDDEEIEGYASEYPEEGLTGYVCFSEF